MERRSAERYYIDLPADASSCAEPGVADKATRVQIRDISSAGTAFYDGRDWSVGEKINMVIHVGNGIVGPFSYSLKARGRIVRKDFVEYHGKAILAVSFDEGIRMSDWMDVDARASGANEEHKGAPSDGTTG